MRRCNKFWILLLLVLIMDGFLSVSLAAQGERLWRMDYGPTWSTPCVVGGRVFQLNQDEGIACFRASDGELLWEQSYPGGGPSSPIYRNGWLYTSCGNVLYQLDPKTGLANNSVDVGEYLSSQSPAVSQDKIFVGTFSGIHAFSAQTLVPVWQVPIGGANFALANDILYVFADQLYALNPANGTEYWHVASPNGDGFNQGAINGDYLVAFEKYSWDSGLTQLVAYDLNDTPTSAPAVLWSSPMGSAYSDNAPPAMSGDMAFAASREGVLRAFALPGDGTPVWTRPVRGENLAPALPIVVGGNVYIQENSQLVCLDGVTGNLLWTTSETEMGIAWGEPALVDGIVYLATDWTGLYAFDAGTVEGKWYMMKQNPHVTGSDNGWGPPPIPDIRANGSDGPISVSPSDPVSIDIRLYPGNRAGDVADWWIAVNTPFAPPGDWYSYVYPHGWWPGVHLCAQAGLFDLAPFEVLNMTLPVGTYNFYFALDDPDGAAAGPWWGLDSVVVEVR